MHAFSERPETGVARVVRAWSRLERAGVSAERCEHTVLTRPFRAKASGGERPVEGVRAHGIRPVPPREANQMTAKAVFTTFLADDGCHGIR